MSGHSSGEAESLGTRPLSCIRHRGPIARTVNAMRMMGCVADCGRTYHGDRNAAADEPADRGELAIYLREHGSIRALHHVVFHSSGFEWGYPGAGPGDLALSLLADALDLDDDVAVNGKLRQSHQVFKRQVVSRLPHRGWSMPRAVVLEWFRRWRDGTDLPPDCCEVCGAPEARVREGSTAWCDQCWEMFGNPDRFDGEG